MSIRGVRRLGLLEAPEGSMILYSYSQNPNVPNNPNPIYAPGSPQYLAAIASGANPNQPAYTPEQIAAMAAGPVGPATNVSPISASQTPLTVAPVQLPAPAPAPTNVSPISATQTPPAATSFQYTADEEAVQQLLYQYGDTWDNPETIVNQLYAAGVAPGTVTQAAAFPYLTNVNTAAATPESSITTTLAAIPVWGWAAIGVGALFMFSKK
jgi:hypothetical protein